MLHIIKVMIVIIGPGEEADNYLHLVHASVSSPLMHHNMFSL